jgi:2-polyprenyl-3-methyl-5-hydroxy-6-metoxy-1,4-benzoquinol methylase
VIRLSAIPECGEILEIGCGTGKAAEMLASRGYAMLCLDIGINLAEIASRKFRDRSKIQIELSSFEEWESGGRLFDLAIAATSFHWIDPAIAYVKSEALSQRIKKLRLCCLLGYSQKREAQSIP